MVPELGPSHVKGDGVEGTQVGVAVDKNKRGLRVDKPTDRPRRGDPIDMDLRASDKPHRRQLAPRVSGLLFGRPAGCVALLLPAASRRMRFSSAAGNSPTGSTQASPPQSAMSSAIQSICSWRSSE